MSATLDAPPPATRAALRADSRRRRGAAVRRGKLRGAVRGTLIGVLGTLGFVTIGWLVISHALGLALIHFVTGSMAPGMPIGTAAVVTTIQAPEIAVGDVVVVHRRIDRQQVTHRVVTIEAGATEGERILALQGDANDTPDQERYRVAAVGKVLVAVPGLATALLAVKSPLGIGVTSLLAATAILWAFWPTDDAPAEPGVGRRSRR